MATSLGVTPPELVSFDKPADWPRWIRRFDQFTVASQLNKQGDDAEVNMLMYYMGDEAMISEVIHICRGRNNDVRNGEVEV